MSTRTMQETVDQLQGEINELEAEVERLKMYEKWDQEYVQCEGCQRYTPPSDIVRDAGEGEEICCCRWCVALDRLQAEVERLRAVEQAARGLVEHIKTGDASESSWWDALRGKLAKVEAAATPGGGEADDANGE